MSISSSSIPVVVPAEARTIHKSGSVKKATAFFGWKEWIKVVYGHGRTDNVAMRTRLHPEVVDGGNFHLHASRLNEVEAIFSTWGMPSLTPGQLDAIPNLRAVFFAGGSVRNFARPLLERDILVVSAWQANAIPAAEFTLAQILLGGKGYFRNTASYKSPENRETAFRGNGNFGEVIAILGAGAVGKKVIGFLKHFHLNIVVFDPFLNDETARMMGVERVSLKEAFERAYVVSNHLANVPETAGMLDGNLFARMRPDATFINTGRGMTVDEDSMIRVFQARPDLTALLDVTVDEPPTKDSPLYTLPNIHLTTHIAGSIGNELVRMADYCIEEFTAWENGGPLRFAVSLDMLETMA